MNNFIFENSTKVYLGKGCVKEYLSCLMKGYGDTVLLACGENTGRGSNVHDEVTGILKSAGKDIIEFPDIMSNPTYSKVQEGAELAKKHQAGMILGVGDGSVMDCCKAVSIAARYDGDAWEDFWARPGVFSFAPLPVGAVATSINAGSGCSGSMVITNTERKVCSCRDYPKCNPRFALFDPSYICSDTKDQIISDAFDVLSYIMEIYFNGPDEDNVSDDLAEALMKNVIRNLRTAAETPEDYTARSNLMWDAAMAKNRIIGLGKHTDFECRQMEYHLEAYKDCRRGSGLAVLQPVHYRRICRAHTAKFKRFALNVWGIQAGGKSDEETALAGVEALSDFVREMGLPGTLRELGIREDTDPGAIAGSCRLVSGCYRKIRREEMQELFQECLQKNL